jgi:O-antigen/teichoic acid export membrane protein
MVNILNYPEATKMLVYISIIAMNLDSFTAGFFAIIRGFHNLIFESIASVIFQIIVLVFGVSALRLGLDLRWLVVALVTASSFNFFYSYTISSRTLGFLILPKWNSIIIRQIVILTAPFAFYAIFQKAYMYLDAVLLSKMAGDYFVGIYQVPFKIVFALQFLPMAFTASLYPAMSSYWVNNRKQLAISFERAMNYLIIISVPIAIGISVLSDKIVLLFKSGYTDAVLPMQIIMLALIFIFINFPIGSLLNACEKQRTNTINMGIVLLASIILNIILIPKFQAVGATITVLTTNALMFMLGIYWVPKLISFNAKKIVLIFLKVAVSAGLMTLLILVLKPYWNIFLIIAISGLAYFAILFLLKGFKKEDVLSIYNSFIKKKTNE